VTRPARPGPGLVTNAIVELRRREAEEHLPRREDEVYVVDLVRCPLKRRFEMLYPQLVHATLQVLEGGPAPRYERECRYCPFRTICSRRRA